MSFPDSTINGVSGEYMDLRREDWPEGEQYGISMPNPDVGFLWRPWKARIKEGWLIGDGSTKTIVVKQLDDRTKNLPELPDHWWDFVAVANSTGMTKYPIHARYEGDIDPNTTYARPKVKTSPPDTPDSV